MTQRFVSCDREQVLLMPVSLREWLPENHLAWFVLAAVEELDLSAFYAAYRQDANGRPAHDPAGARDADRRRARDHRRLPASQSQLALLAQKQKSTPPLGRATAYA